jgi:hypothetical protein
MDASRMDARHRGARRGNVARWRRIGLALASFVTGVAAVACAYLFWRRITRRTPVPSFAPEAAAYAAQLVTLHAVLTGEGRDALVDLYDVTAPDLPLRGPPASRFGRSLVYGDAPQPAIRVFAETYAARYGHTVDEVACEVVDLWQTHNRVWSAVIERLPPGSDVCDALAGMRADLEQVFTEPPDALAVDEASALLEELSPVYRFLTKLLARSLQLRAAADHLARVRACIAEAQRAS